MTVVSKELFNAVCSDVPCRDILHPWTDSCLKANLDILKGSLIGSPKFYSIVYLAQILMRGKHMTKKKSWIKMGDNYLRSTALGVLVSTVAIQISCLLSLTGIFIYLEPPGRRGLIINLFCNLVIEYFLKTQQAAGNITLNKSKIIFMFMVGSSLLLYLMRLEGEKEKRTPLFWLFTAEKVRKRTDNTQNICPHEGSCKNYIFKGIGVYSAIGLGISLARLILPQLRTPVKAISSIRGKHLKLALFFSSYIGIYRAVVCYLCRRQGVDSALYALPAGYAAGLSLVFNPNLGLSIASVTAAFKLYSTILYEKKILPSNIPLPEILYCLCQGLLFSSRVLSPDNAPGYVFNLTKTVSNGRMDLAAEGFYKIINNAL